MLTPPTPPAVTPLPCPPRTALVLTDVETGTVLDVDITVSGRMGGVAWVQGERGVAVVAVNWAL